jgi:endoglucanase
MIDKSYWRSFNNLTSSVLNNSEKYLYTFKGAGHGFCFASDVPRYEHLIREFILNQVSPYAQCSVDQNGNIICFKKGKNTPAKKIMIDAHMDEVGIIATSITSDGFVKFDTVGGIDTAVMLCRRVRFQNGVLGVIGLKPVHLTSAEQRKKLPKKDELYIDIGSSSKEETEKLISVGDTAVFESEVCEIDGRIKARAIDDRAGVACLITLLKEEAEYDFYATFTVQEEVGLRGAKPPLLP